MALYVATSVHTLCGHGFLPCRDISSHVELLDEDSLACHDLRSPVSHNVLHVQPYRGMGALSKIPLDKASSMSRHGNEGMPCFIPFLAYFLPIFRGLYILHL